MSGEWVWLTDREAAAVAFIVAAALEDEEPSDVRAALLRALRKLRRTTGVKFGSVGGVPVDDINAALRHYRVEEQR